MHPLTPKFPHLLHGGDYNPDQWLDRPDILEEDVRLMKQTVGDRVRVKAAGGIRSWESCRAMLEAGAERIGTSSSIRILNEFIAWRDRK